MPSKSKVCFFFESGGFKLTNRTALKAFIVSLFRSEKHSLSSISYIFCSDQRLLEINRQFLRHDYYTDIITFDLSESASIQAEVYISIDRVRENARQLNTTLKEELHRVIFHGALHLCGYRDKTKAEAMEMRKREDLYLSRYSRRG